MKFAEWRCYTILLLKNCAHTSEREVILKKILQTVLLLIIVPVIVYTLFYFIEPTSSSKPELFAKIVDQGESRVGPCEIRMEVYDESFFGDFYFVQYYAKSVDMDKWVKVAHHRISESGIFPVVGFETMQGPSEVDWKIYGDSEYWLISGDCVGWSKSIR